MSDIVINPYFRRQDVILKEVAELVMSGQTVPMVMPFGFDIPGMIITETWWLPYEPLVSVSGENVIAMRNVAKSSGRGTIKERWATGDIRITIEGVFVNSDMTKYPAAEVQQLREIIELREPIRIQNELLQLLNVNQIVIESYKLPHTKGENVQNFIIEAVSDDNYDLFIKLN